MMAKSLKTKQVTRLAVVHDWLNVYGGAERLLAGVLTLIPDAHLFSLFHHPSALEHTPLAGREVTTSFLQQFPLVGKYYRGLLPLMPAAVGSLNVSGFPFVLSISHAVAHGVRTSPGQTHVAYICTPMRYAWHLRDDYLGLYRLDRPLLGWLARKMLHRLQQWDRGSARQADHFLAISAWTAARMKQAWGQTARVIYPPVDVDRFCPADVRDDYYLVVSRFVPYKLIPRIIQAFNRMKRQLVVVGDGPELSHASRIAGPTVRLLGSQPDEVVTDLMNRARAFIHMALEDFGIAMVEAQAAGCPVIAYHRGGAAEIVIDGATGLLYPEQKIDVLVDTVSEFERIRRDFDPVRMQENAARFSSARFREEFWAFIQPFLDAI